MMELLALLLGERLTSMHWEAEAGLVTPLVL